MTKWYESEECNQSPVIGGQICLLRNIDGFSFENKMTKEEQRLLLQNVCYAVREEEKEMGLQFTFYHLNEISNEEYRALIERMSVWHKLLMEDHETGLMISKDESVSLLINGREHICIQVSFPGNKIQEAYETAMNIERLLNKHLVYAYSKRYGYLTAAPQFVGTGMQASCLLHLPVIKKKNLIESVEKGLVQYGFTLEPHFSGRIPSPGAIYRMHNKKTLGVSETEILSALKYFMQKTADEESVMEKHLMAEQQQEEENLIYRTYGIMKYARSLGLDETLTGLSILHVGDMNGLWPEQKKVADVALFYGIQDAMIRLRNRSGMTGAEVRQQRADYIRKNMGSIDPD